MRSSVVDLGFEIGTVGSSESANWCFTMGAKLVLRWCRRVLQRTVACLDERAVKVCHCLSLGSGVGDVSRECEFAILRPDGGFVRLSGSSCAVWTSRFEASTFARCCSRHYPAHHLAYPTSFSPMPKCPSPTINPSAAFLSPQPSPPPVSTPPPTPLPLLRHHHDSESPTYPETQN